MRVHFSKIAQGKQEWVSAGFQRLFGSRDGITDPAKLRSIFLTESQFVAELGSYGFTRGVDWRLQNGFEYPKGGILEEEGEILAKMKQSDDEIVAEVGGSDAGSMGYDTYLDYSENTRFDYFRPEYLFVYPVSASPDELKIRKLYGRQFTRRLSEVGVKRNVDWSVGPAQTNSTSTYHLLYYNIENENTVEQFEHLVTFYERELRTAIRSYQQNPDFARSILGNEGASQISQEITTGTFASIRDYLYGSESPFSQFDFSFLNDDDIMRIVEYVDRVEKSVGTAFEVLPPHAKVNMIRRALNETNVMPALMPEFQEETGVFDRFIGEISSSYGKYDKLRELARKRGIKLPSFPNRANGNLYVKMIGANDTDSIKVNMFLLEALYNNHRSTSDVSPERAKYLFGALVYYILLDVLRGYRNSAAYRAVPENEQLTRERARDYNSHVNGMIGEFTDNDYVTRILNDTRENPQRFVLEYPTIESLRGSLAMREIRSKVVGLMNSSL